VKVGDLVKSNDYSWDGKGIIIEYQEGRIHGEDSRKREYKVHWYYAGCDIWLTPPVDYQPVSAQQTWAMEIGIEVYSSAKENKCEDIKE
tara:strand:+ start:163 stop:429 length:267 start_codon:yes stop_codon:yes gene_type:complete